MTFRDEIAASAPEAPSWFRRLETLETFIIEHSNGMRSLAKNNKVESEEDRFFRWRYFYADRMLSERRKFEEDYPEELLSERKSEAYIEAVKSGKISSDLTPTDAVRMGFPYTALQIQKHGRNWEKFT